MIDKEDFEFHKSIVDWMMNKGVPFMEAMSICSYAEQSDRCIPVAYFEIKQEMILMNECQADEKINSE